MPIFRYTNTLRMINESFFLHSDDKKKCMCKHKIVINNDFSKHKVVSHSPKIYQSRYIQSANIIANSKTHGLHNQTHSITNNVAPLRNKY